MTLVIDEAHSERQLQAILFALVTLGYIDGTFDSSERRFVEDRIQELVDEWISRSDFYQNIDPGFVESIKRYEKRHLFEVLEAIDQSLNRLMATEVGVDDKPADFISSRLMLRCFEVLTELNEEQRQGLMEMIDRLIEADGKIDPAEVAFRNALLAEMARKPPHAPPATDHPFEFEVSAVKVACPDGFGHPLLAEVERPFPADDSARQADAESDIALMQRAITLLGDIRTGGWGRLDGVRTLAELSEAAPFIDCLAYCFPQSGAGAADYIVVGDLHGCYGSLKAVLAQSDFLNRVERHRRDPENAPDVKLIFLGDYLDRGRFAWEGVVRTVFRLFVEHPHYVVPLVGNHEWLIERDGKIVSSVIPADAVDTWAPRLPAGYLAMAKSLFDQLPSVVLIDRIILVHGGVPRHSHLANWRGLSSLNDPQVRLEMCWSDPVMISEVDTALQEQSQRFAFGMSQFTGFMDAIGARVMIRGHEKVGPGFKKEYDDGRYRLFTVFSAGGYNNRDLPEETDYRNVQPAYVEIQRRDGKFVANPVRIAWEKFNDPRTNRFQEDPR